ncbi:MAG: DUF3307 domain-containing protein [Bacteroidota bacterium]
MSPVIFIFFLHFVGDFVFQTSQMALNKSKSIKWLTLHILTYTAVIFVGVLLIFDLQLAIYFTLVNAGLHWVTDFFTSKLNARLNQMENKRWFFTGIGFDQFIHATCLLATYEHFSS